MSLEICAYFSKSAHHAIVAKLRSTSAHLMPIMFGKNETRFDKNNEIDNPEKYEHFVRNAGATFFLAGKKTLFTFYTSLTPDYSYLMILPRRGELEDSDAEQLLTSIQEVATFSYACQEDEYLQSNRVAVQLDNGSTVESWVGRRYERYIPGLYWRTYLSAEAVGRVDRTRLSAEISRVPTARAHELPDGGLRIGLGDASIDWKTWAQPTSLAVSNVAGLFSISRVLKSIRDTPAARTSYAVLSELLAPWP